MKKLFLFVLTAVLFTSCISDDSIEEQEFYFEILPIEQVFLPETFTYGEIYQIEYNYYKPTTCYSFNELYYLIEGDFRTVAVINSVFEKNDGLICEPLNEELEWRVFNFECTKNFGSYIFQFWQGQDSNGNDTYLTYEVPVE